MKYLKRFENLSQNDIQEIKDLFQCLVDDWDLFDLSLCHQSNIFPAVDNTKIEYKFYIDYKLENNLLTDRVDDRNPPFIYLDEYSDSSEWSDCLCLIYLNLAGPNDFFRTRNKFLEDVDILTNRLGSSGFRNHLSQNKYYTSKFILCIYKQ